MMFQTTTALVFWRIARNSNDRHGILIRKGLESTSAKYLKGVGMRS